MTFDSVISHSKTAILNKNRKKLYRLEIIFKKIVISKYQITILHEITILQLLSYFQLARCEIADPNPILLVFSSQVYHLGMVGPDFFVMRLPVVINGLSWAVLHRYFLE
jgi:hypothetical protein